LTWYALRELKLIVYFKNLDCNCRNTSIFECCFIGLFGSKRKYSRTNTLDKVSTKKETYINISSLTLHPNTSEFEYMFIESSECGTPIASPNNNISKNNISKQFLIKILSDPNGIMLFAQYLLKEMSIENLLSIIEMTQYQNIYHTKSKLLSSNSSPNNYSNNNNNNNDIKQPLLRQTKLNINHEIKIIKLPPNIPNSSIVFDKNLSIKQKALCLCEKYIGNPKPNKNSNKKPYISLERRNTIMFGLNIEYITKKRVYKTLNNPNYNDICPELAHIFDDVIINILQIMMDPLLRFNKTQIGNKVLSEIKRNQSSNSLTNNSLNKLLLSTSVV